MKMLRYRILYLLFAIISFHENVFSQDRFKEADILWLDTNEILTFDQLEKVPFIEKSEGVLSPRTYYYVKVSDISKVSDTFPVLFCRDFIQIEYVSQEGARSIFELGWSSKSLPLNIEFPDSLRQASTIYLRCYNYEQRSAKNPFFYWLTEDFKSSQFDRIDDESVINLIVPNTLSTGLIIAFILFFGVLYLSNPSQKLYLYYILYLIPLAIYLFHRSIFVRGELLPKIAIDFPYWFIFTNYPIQVLFHISYTLFTFSFLNAKQDYPLYYKVAKFMIAFAGVFFIILSIGMYVQPFGTIWVNAFQAERLLVSLFSIWSSFYVITHQKNRMSLIIAYGSIIFLAGAWGAFFYHMNLMRVGSIIEVLFFSYGIGYKFRLERIEKDEIKTALINQLQEKEALQRKYSSELEKEVKVRSEELVDKAKQIEEEKKLKLKAQLEKKLEETKMIAMRSQMNPHFLFNSLNSIRHLIIRNKTTEAYDYLSKFAVLMRSVLENAEKDVVLISDELALIKTYVSLEKLRFSDDFKFDISINNNALTYETCLPPLLIQPFLENAIIHGLASKKNDKLLLLNIDILKDRVLITVEDNGIGRKNKSKDLEEKPHKSMAIDIANERLELFTNYYSKDVHFTTSIKIKDKTSATGNALGTVVLIELPLVKQELI